MAPRERLPLTRLVETHYEEIKSYLQRKTGSASTAADLVQETWLRVARHAAKLPDNPLGYIYRTASNLLLDKQRHEQMHGRYFSDDADLEASQCPLTTPDEAAVVQQEMQLLADAVRDLPEKCRAVFLLYRGEELSAREIAERLNISVSTVEKHIAKAMQHCRQRLTDARGAP
ncbi:ECF RNA polymerase sigma factor SigL [Pseudomonas reidholzensis]|uniref:ECF RNA polymerase sigma factor SigL n=1 Tax=Pseudomonas reidholzensis TaxID=1785162 RepID=A0A383RPL2_9PSED|nr:RNA polymerase sigma factor [Pseudomonas reidholzensis]SYX89019.1 ECF RNA polymerase sigma factor SigL [Pseudomonas reidholzensis]